MLLKILTGQHDIPPESSAWIDYVETEPHDLQWANLLPSPNPNQDDFIDDILGTSSPQSSHPASGSGSAPDRDISSNRNRKTVEIPEDPKSGVRPRPMTKEQMIWDEALKRSENKTAQWQRLLFWLSLIVSFALLTLFVHKKSNGFKNIADLISFDQIKSLSRFEFGTSTESNPRELDAPEWYWSHHHHAINPLDQHEIKSYLRQTSSSLAPSLSKWVLQKAELKAPQQIYCRLLIQEQSFLSPPIESSRAWHLNRLKPTTHQWNVERQGAESSHQSFFVSETIRNNSAGIELSLKRASGKNGIAHRVILDARGLLAWSWRIKLEDTVLDGQLIRKSKPLRYMIKCKIAEDHITHNVLIDPKHALHLPAIASPTLMSFFPRANIVHPLSGSLSSGAEFLEAFEPMSFLNTQPPSTEPPQNIIWSSRAQGWRERWKLSKP